MEQIVSSIVSALAVALISALGKFIKDLYQNSDLKSKNNKSWPCKTQKGSFSCYVSYLIFCIFTVVIIPVIAGVLYIPVYISNVENKNILYFFAIGIFLYFILILYTNLFVVPKRKLFNYKKDEIKGKIRNFIIWNFPLVDSAVAFGFLCFCREDTAKMYVALILIFVIEICAGFYLDDDPTFQFKKVRLILEDNDMVSNINSDTFCVKEKWFVGICTYKKEEKEIRVPQEKVKRIEYYDKQF